MRTHKWRKLIDCLPAERQAHIEALMRKLSGELPPLQESEPPTAEPAND